ncbi:MAG: hypothetical protein K9W46_06050 [Candidatus Heimdallarchaeum endolithica]|uniref:Uncharacterized protein n=1 Tax=Candidatus Heimdallarchaeum endolithica TaxID=2876572 RepID=A0A9Y1FQ65_9ARCH|nr:MAG: hypothetical protein K9W46_06050 [Candidatus Heimdallarchaeum endolithica]
MIPYHLQVLLTNVQDIEKVTIKQLIESDVKIIKGIGNKYAKVLHRKGIKKVKDLAESESQEINLPEKLVTKWIVAARIITNSQKVRRTGKIIFSGLSQAGKTSIVYVLKSIVEPPTVTTGVKQDFIKFAGHNIQISDMGGQKRFQEIYLAAPDLYFERTKLVFYVIDIQNKEKTDDSLEYLQRLLAIYRYLQEKPFISIFLHKFDPDLSYDLKYDIPPIKEKIENIFSHYVEFQHNFFYTSIYNPPSIYVGIASTLSEIFPVMSILDVLLKDFAELHGFDGLLIMDSTGMLIGQFIRGEQDSLVEETYSVFKEAKNAEKNPFNNIVLRKNIADPPGGEIVVQQIFLPHNDGYIFYWRKENTEIDLLEYMLSEITKTLNPWLYNLLS